MGTWGFKISEDDIASDVYADYFERFNGGAEPAEVLRRLQEQYSAVLRDEDDQPSFWLAVAKAQWECGHVDHAVYLKIDGIAKSVDASSRWREAGPEALRHRRRAIEQFIAKISVPNPKPKVRRKATRRKPIYLPGDCIAIHLADGDWGAALVLQLPAEREIPGRDTYGWNLVGVLHFKSKAKPTEEVFRRREWLRLTHHNWTGRVQIVKVMKVGYRGRVMLC